MNSKCWYCSVCTLCESSCCDADCIRFYKMKYLLDNSLLPEEEQTTSKLVAEDIDKEVFLELNKIKESISEVITEGRNLLLFSKITGNGKSAWAKKLLFSYFDSIWHITNLEPRALYIDVNRFFNALRENISKPNDYIKLIQENIFKVDLVIWDEVGIKDLTGFEHGYMLSYIDGRISRRKSNIFTSNLNEEEMLTVLGDRLYSRIVNNSKVLEFKGRDKRALNKW